MSADVLLKLILHGVYAAVVVLFFFGLTIFAHEWGHYLMARRRGMIVERFSYFGLGPPIVKWVRNGIEYCICWIPVGAYVQIPQMAPMELLEGESRKKAEELPPVTNLTKILVALAGPAMNLIFAFGLACVLWIVGSPSQSTVVGWVEPGSAEELAGVRPGDRVVQINEQPVKNWGELVEAVAFSTQPTVAVTIERDHQRLVCNLEAKVNKAFHVKVLEIFPRQRPYAGRLLPGKPAEKAGICNGDRFVAIEGVPLFSREQMVSRIGERADQPTAIRLLRDGQMLTVTVTPEYNKEDKAGRIGVELGEDLEIVRPGPTPLAQFADILSSMGRFVKAIVRHKETGVGVKSAMGPVGISYAWWAAIMTGGLLLGVKIGVLLNLNLAIVNLLPIPVLDGGHIIFATIEAIRRKPLNAKFVARIQTVFAVLLLGLMLYITVFSDLQRFLPNRRKPAANTVAPTNAP